VLPVRAGGHPEAQGPEHQQAEAGSSGPAEGGRDSCDRGEPAAHFGGAAGQCASAGEQGRRELRQARSTKHSESGLPDGQPAGQWHRPGQPRRGCDGLRRSRHGGQSGSRGHGHDAAAGEEDGKHLDRRRWRGQ